MWDRNETRERGQVGVPAREYEFKKILKRKKIVLFQRDSTSWDFSSCVCFLVFFFVGSFAGVSCFAVFCVAAVRCQPLNYERVNTLVINTTAGFSARYTSQH